MNNTDPENLIILPCHSIWSPGKALGNLREEWALAPFQIEGNDHLCFKEHIKISVELLTKDPKAALIISGGQTKKDSGPVLEALSYYHLGHALMPQQMTTNSCRIILEEYARDSFENVLFLICRFFEFFGKYPNSIIVVGFEFKRQRFVQQHLQQALLFPPEKIDYVGNSPNPSYEDENRRLKYFRDLDLSEAQHACDHFKVDWYGIQEVLSSKKTLRDPFHRTHGYSISNPLIAPFLVAIGKINSSASNESLRQLLVLPWITSTNN